MSECQQQPQELEEAGKVGRVEVAQEFCGLRLGTHIACHGQRGSVRSFCSFLGRALGTSLISKFSTVLVPFNNLSFAHLMKRGSSWAHKCARGLRVHMLKRTSLAIVDMPLGQDLESVI